MAQISQIKHMPFFGKNAVLLGMCILDVGHFWFICFFSDEIWETRATAQASSVQAVCGPDESAEGVWCGPDLEHSNFDIWVFSWLQSANTSLDATQSDIIVRYSHHIVTLVSPCYLGCVSNLSTG